MKPNFEAHSDRIVYNKFKSHYAFYHIPCFLILVLMWGDSRGLYIIFLEFYIYTSRFNIYIISTNFLCNIRCLLFNLFNVFYDCLCTERQKTLTKIPSIIMNHNWAQISYSILYQAHVKNKNKTKHVCLSQNRVK